MPDWRPKLTEVEGIVDILMTDKHSSLWELTELKGALMQWVLPDTATSRCHSGCQVCVLVLCSAIPIDAPSEKGTITRNESTSDLLELEGVAEFGGVAWRDLKHP